MCNRRGVGKMEQLKEMQNDDRRRDYSEFVEGELMIGMKMIFQFGALRFQREKQSWAHIERPFGCPSALGV